MPESFIVSNAVLEKVALDEQSSKEVLEALYECRGRLKSLNVVLGSIGKDKDKPEVLIVADTGASNGMEDRERFDKMVGMIAEWVGFNFDTAVTALDDEICFFQDGENRALRGHEVIGQAVAAETKDEDCVPELIEDMLGPERDSTKHKNVTIHRISNSEYPCYVQMDNVVVFSDEKTVAAAIDAAQSNNALKNSDPYRRLVEKLPESNVLEMHYDVHSSIHQNKRVTRNLLGGVPHSKLT